MRLCPVLLADNVDWGVQGQFTGYFHYYHLFGEGFLAGLGALAAALDPIIDLSRPEEGEALMPDFSTDMTIPMRFESEGYSWKQGKGTKSVDLHRVIVPWDPDWRDKHGINEYIFRHLYGDSKPYLIFDRGLLLANVHPCRYRRSCRVEAVVGFWEMDQVRQR